jgi:hypothetical protein
MGQRLQNMNLARTQLVFNALNLFNGSGLLLGAWRLLEEPDSSIDTSSIQNCLEMSNIFC